jgi:cytochrome c5
MKRSSILISCLAGAFAILPLIAQPTAPKGNSQVPPAQSKHAPPPAYSSDGERVFKQNCSRCHEAPQSFPPQISGTVVRHMRVRASLSEQDEKLILKFLNP